MPGKSAGLQQRQTRQPTLNCNCVIKLCFWFLLHRMWWEHRCHRRRTAANFFAGSGREHEHFRVHTAVHSARTRKVSWSHLMQICSLIKWHLSGFLPRSAPQLDGPIYIPSAADTHQNNWLKLYALLLLSPVQSVNVDNRFKRTLIGVLLSLRT